jgi:hypothetical protein
MPDPSIDHIDFETADAIMRTHVLDIAGIAALLDVSEGTVQLWNSKSRAILPLAPWSRAGAPLWFKPHMVAWAKTTGRWKRKRVNRFDAPDLVPNGAPNGSE